MSCGSNSSASLKRWLQPYQLLLCPYQCPYQLLICKPYQPGGTFSASTVTMPRSTIPIDPVSCRRHNLDCENLWRRTVNLRRPERARNEGKTGPETLDDTRCTTFKQRINYMTETLSRETSHGIPFNTAYQSAINFQALIGTNLVTWNPRIRNQRNLRTSPCEQSRTHTVTAPCSCPLRSDNRAVLFENWRFRTANWDCRLSNSLTLCRTGLPRS